LVKPINPNYLEISELLDFYTFFIPGKIFIGIGRLSALYNATELKIFNSVLEMIFESG
jgi:hypothetical protein